MSIRNLNAARRAIKESERNGDLLDACDLASRALATWPDDLELRYLHTRALARAGATENAMAAFDRYSLSRVRTARPPLDVDVPTLGARLLKDRALGTLGRSRVSALLEAAESYRRVYGRSLSTGRETAYYPAVNAAALCIWAGQRRRGQELARESLSLAQSAPTSYWSLVSTAESYLLLGQERLAGDALAAAMRTAGDAGAIDWQQVATTRRQLRRTIACLGLDRGVLAPLRPPAVLTYSGHMIGARFGRRSEKDVARAIADTLRAYPSIAAYGSLAAGADILIAESLLAHNVELHLAFPFSIDDFKRISVQPSGRAWSRRFDACLRDAKSVRFVAEGGYLGHPGVFRSCSRLSMGRALLRASPMDADASMLAVWDGEPAGNGAIAGTSSDVEEWSRTGRAVHVVAPARPAAMRSYVADFCLSETRRSSQGCQPSSPVRLRGAGASANARQPSLPSAHCGDASAKAGKDRRAPAIAPRPARPGVTNLGHGPNRRDAALLFGDVRNFSQLNDAKISGYVNCVLGTVAKALRRHAKSLLAANSWGDAFFAAIADSDEAARVAWEIQQRLQRLDGSALGMPNGISMRIGASFGPVEEVLDPVSERPTFMGVQVVQAARIEPVTEPGMVWVTEAFAASLALAPRTKFSCAYLGRIALAKSYGSEPLYLLRRGERHRPATGRN